MFAFVDDGGHSFIATPLCASASMHNECLDTQAHSVKAVSFSSRAGWHKIPVFPATQMSTDSHLHPLLDDTSTTLHNNNNK